MTFFNCKSKLCPFMSARFNRSPHASINEFSRVYCLVSECMAFVVTKEYESLPSGSALYDIQGDLLPYDQREGFCKLLKVSHV